MVVANITTTSTIQLIPLDREQIVIICTTQDKELGSWRFCRRQVCTVDRVIILIPHEADVRFRCNLTIFIHECCITTSVVRTNHCIRDTRTIVIGDNKLDIGEVVSPNVRHPIVGVVTILL